MHIVTESVKNLGKDLTSQQRSIEYHANILNQFVENGYEVYTEAILLNKWWEKRESVQIKRIFFQRDYSSRPQLFFGVSQIKKFTIQEEGNPKDRKNVILSVTLKEVMTSYFAVEIRITCNAEIKPSAAMIDYPPVISITYVLLNRRE